MSAENKSKSGQKVKTRRGDSQSDNPAESKKLVPPRLVKPEIKASEEIVDLYMAEFSCW